MLPIRDAAFTLHTDYHWEQTLPNLNPSKNKMGTSWALDTLLDGVLYKVIQRKDNKWVWVDRQEDLGANLASALYKLGESFRIDRVRTGYNDSLKKASADVSPEELARRTDKLLTYIKDTLLDIGMATQKGQKTREASLEEPIWGMFEDRLEARPQPYTRSAAQETALAAFGIDWAHPRSLRRFGKRLIGGFASDRSNRHNEIGRTHS